MSGLGEPVPSGLSNPVRPGDGWLKVEVWIKQPKPEDVPGEPVMLIGVTEEGEGTDARFIYWEKSKIGYLHHEGSLDDEFELQVKDAYTQKQVGILGGYDWSLFGLKPVMPKIVVKGVKEDAG